MRNICVLLIQGSVGSTKFYNIISHEHHSRTRRGCTCGGKRQDEDLIAAAADGQADDASALPTRAKAQDAQAKAKAQAFA